MSNVIISAVSTRASDGREKKTDSENFTPRSHFQVDAAIQFSCSHRGKVPAAGEVQSKQGANRHKK